MHPTKDVMILQNVQLYFLLLFIFVFIFRFYLVLYFYLADVLLVCMPVHYMRAVPAEARSDHWIPGAGVTSN